MWLVYFITTIIALSINGFMRAYNDAYPPNKKWDEEYHDKEYSLNSYNHLIWVQGLIGFLIFVWFNAHIVISIGEL